MNVWTSEDGELPDYIDPDYIETEYEREHEDSVDVLSERDRKLIAEVLCRFVDRDISARGVRETYKPECVSVMAYDLWFFAQEMLSCVDGDNVDLAKLAASVADGYHE